MSFAQENSPFRLPKKHGRGQGVDVTVADGECLINAQSLRNAVVSGLVSIVLFSTFWVLLTSLFEQRFPWFTVILGVLLGYIIRVSGRGIDWRFPAVAIVLTMVGSLAANVVVAASVTADGYGTGTLDILSSVTSMTWPVFFDERLQIADAFFAVVAAAFAAFYSTRNLTRSQYHALRLWREAQDE